MWAARFSLKGLLHTLRCGCPCKEVENRRQKPRNRGVHFPAVLLSGLLGGLWCFAFSSIFFASAGNLSIVSSCLISRGVLAFPFAGFLNIFPNLIDTYPNR